MRRCRGDAALGCCGPWPHARCAAAGAGLIISHGFMKRHWQQVQQCLQQPTGCKDAGCWLATCMWAAGSAATDPGPGLMSGERSYVMFGNSHAQELLSGAGEQVAAGRCDEDCSWLLTHAVSVQVGARPQPLGVPGS